MADGPLAGVFWRVLKPSITPTQASLWLADAGVSTVPWSAADRP